MTSESNPIPTPEIKPESTTTATTPMQDISQSKKRAASTDLSENAPEAKKQKLNTEQSNSSSSRGPQNEAGTNEQRKKLTPKRKVALVIGYKGTNFHGNQIQPDEATVEGEVWRVLKETDAIMPANQSDPKKIGWARTSRTDRGVHALVNIIECKLHVYDELVPELNKLLQKPDGSNDVMVHGYSRVTGGFKARMSCDGREYWYLLPTFVFNQKDKVLRYDDTQENATNKDKLDQRMFQISQDDLDQCVDRSYRMSDEDVAGVNEIMKNMEGTHYFHNFTRLSKVVKQHQTQRFVTNFSIEKPFFDEATNLEWTVVHIYGSSFLFNQIRKMIGAVIAIRKGIFDKNIFDTVFDSKVEMYTPRIPGHGLMLKDMKFGAYNNQKGAQHGELYPFKDFQENIQIFKKQLFRHIMALESDNQEWQRWVYLMDKVIKTERDPIDYEKASQREENITVEAETEIETPIEKIWEHVGDFAKLPHITMHGVESVKFDDNKPSTEPGVMRIVCHKKEHIVNPAQANKTKIKKHTLTSIDSTSYTIEYSSVRMKKYTETSSVSTTIKLTRVDDSKTKLYWKTFIDIGTSKFVVDETARTQKMTQKVKSFFEAPTTTEG
uniref:Pseudouridine synthase I TruA alpha/beta domain-containing protein n=1 Tax=Percolomonas cosmopolitus TaxID=63605 RepID=A0A7S1KQV1_9EUKA|mmetsp:Transcript_5532/g.20822  ORF Transcript_5532/g.20822 Transcript_5532/m.20822 type:complete len:608 (+) Transcript_5532:1-1824(+)